MGEATTAAVEQLVKLDRVMHDFMACMQPGQQGPVAGAGGPAWDNATRFHRILDHTPFAGGPVLGPPVLCGMSPPIGVECLLGFLGSQRRTGVLRVRTADTSFMISVVRGDVVHGVCDPRPEAELLGNILLARGVIGADALRRFFEECGASPSQIVDALNREKLVSTGHLRDALARQMQQLFDRLLVATDAEWCFHEGEATLCYVNMRVNVNRVLLESARKLDEGNAAAVAEAPPAARELQLVRPPPGAATDTRRRRRRS